jgi:hypothetical protein
LAARLQRIYRTMSFAKPFNRLTTLSPGAAQALAQHGVGHLYLDGLTTLSPEAAKALAQHKGGLSLNGLTKLSPKAAEALRANPSQSNKF